MKTNLLNTRKVAAAKKRGYYADGSNLYLQVSEYGTKCWVFRYARDGKVRDLGLGDYPGIRLAHVKRFRRALSQGHDGGGALAGRYVSLALPLQAGADGGLETINTFPGYPGAAAGICDPSEARDHVPDERGRLFIPGCPGHDDPVAIKRLL